MGRGESTVWSNINGYRGRTVELGDGRMAADRAASRHEGIDLSIRAKATGIEIERSAIKALITFAGEPERSLDVVHFRVDSPGADLLINATDGHRACEAVSRLSDPDCVVGEWAVSKDFLSACHRAAKSGQSLLLRVTPTGLRTASILDSEFLEIGSITWKEEAASTQVTMKVITDLLREQAKARSLTGSWYAVQSGYLADLKLIAAACGKDGAVTIYPPVDPVSAIGFEAEGMDVRWYGSVMPVRTEGPGERAVEPEPEAETQDGEVEDGEESVGEAAAKLKETLKKHGATMTLVVGGKPGVTVG